MTAVRGFARFWWEFIVGDDWITAAGVVVAIALTALLSHHGADAWFVMPVAIVGVLWLTLRRATRRTRP